jgi:hypothetical protein
LRGGAFKFSSTGIFRFFSESDCLNIKSAAEAALISFRKQKAQTFRPALKVFTLYIYYINPQRVIVAR